MTRRSPSEWFMLAAGMAALTGVGIWLGFVPLVGADEIEPRHLIGVGAVALGWMMVWFGAFNARISVVNYGQAVAILGVGPLMWGFNPLGVAVTVAISGLVGLRGWRRSKLEDRAR